MKKNAMLILAASLMLASAGAYASDRASSASGGRGPGGGEGEVTPTPVYGGSCYYAYSIQKIGQLVAKPGDSMTYHVFVQNIGTCKLRHIDVDDVLPHGVTFVSSTPSGVVTGHRIEFSDIDLLAGQYQDFVINVTVDTNFDWDRNITNTACAFTPWVGTRICDSVTTFIDVDRHGH